MDNRHVRIMKVALLVGSVGSLIILTVAAVQENFGGEWRAAQSRYRELLIATAPDEHARQSANMFSVEHKQLFLSGLGTIDRCTTCHLGVENPNMATAPPPLQAHPGTLLASHPADTFGCTVCHQGQGRAIHKDQAHGWLADGRMVAHAETPLLRGEAVYSSCGKCHYEVDLFGGLADLHATAGGETPLPIDERTLDGALPGSGSIHRGKQLLVNNGCLGCHKYRGRGGVLGPDITYVGDKTRHDFDFSHVRGAHTVEQWLFEHFMLPQDVSPGTIMPDLGVSDQDARALTRYMMSLHRKTAPASHRPPPARYEERPRPVRGETLYAMFCSSCHGVDGHGSTMRSGLWPLDADPWGRGWDQRNIVIEQRGDLEVFVPSLNHPDTLAVASTGYLRQVISEGRPGTHMIGWLHEGGLSEDEITLLVAAIRSWQPAGAETSEVASRHGSRPVGRALYRANCASCHGADGAGGIGPSLNAATFLAVASDAFLRDTILHGRPDTAMPAWREFSAQEVSDLLAFMRGAWQPAIGSVEGALPLCHEGNDHVSADIGRILYNANCVMCHGTGGAGDLGPSLNTQAFLTAVDDTYLLATLVDGRPGTAMPSWKHFSNIDLASIVLYLRTWQCDPAYDAAWRDTAVTHGDAQSGRIHFIGSCASCHGTSGEGATGPQLNNAVFLRHATDRMLQHWIAFGKEGTEMRAFRKGGQGIAELTDRQIEDIVAYLRSLEFTADDALVRVSKSPHGRPEKGARIFEANCVGCHGSRGEGASGPALSNPAFLRFASDGYLLATMALGRSGTEMRPVKSGPQSILGLTSDEVNDVVAFLRSWEHTPAFDAAAGEIPHRFVVPWDLGRGQALFGSHCAGCHGVDGKGLWAPELNNEGFLAAATDGFLQATIVSGRTATAMRPFGRGAHGLVDLSADDIDDIVAYMRSWSRQTPSPMTIPAERSTARATVATPVDVGSDQPLAAAQRQGDAQ